MAGLLFAEMWNGVVAEACGECVRTEGKDEDGREKAQKAQDYGDAPVFSGY